MVTVGICDASHADGRALSSRLGVGVRRGKIQIRIAGTAECDLAGSALEQVETGSERAGLR